MPVFDVAPYVDEAVRSVLGQEGVDLRLVVVDDGSTDATPEILEALAAQDERLLVLHQEHAGQGAARNLAMTYAVGDYLVFVDGDDVVPPGAYALMAASLESSRSDICLGAVERFDEEHGWQSAWSREVHEVAITGTRLVQHPVVIKDIIACNRMIRLDFWQARGISFPTTGVYEDHMPMLRALVEADGIDVLTEVVYRWRVRTEGTSTGQRKREIANLDARVAVKAAAWEYLAQADATVRDAWLGRVLDVDLPPFLALAAEADDEYRAVLGDFARTYADLAGKQALGWVRGQNRVRARLAADGRWDDVAALDEALAARRLRELTAVEEGELRFDPDLVPVGDLAARWRALPDRQTEASARVLAVSRREATVRLDGAVAIGGMVLGPLLDRCRVVLRTPDGEFPAQVRRRGKGEAAASVAFRVELDRRPASLADLRLTVTVEGMSRTTALRDPDGLLDPTRQPAVPPDRPEPSGPLVASRPGSVGAEAEVAPAPALPAAELAARYGLRQVGVRPTLGAYLADMWRRRDFVRVLASASAYAENSNLYLGQLWAVVRPVLDATVYVLIFGFLLGTSRGMDNIVGFIVVGTFFYRAFSESVSAGARSVARNANLVRSLQFPRALLPLSNVAAEFLALVPALGVMMGFVLASQLGPSHPEVVVSWRWLMLPVATALLAVFSTGAGLIVARITAFFPDLLNTLPFVLRILMYASGVIFSIEHYVDPPWLQIMELQPVAVYLSLARQSLLVEPSIPFDWWLWLLGLGWAVLALGVGFVFFWRAEARYGRD